MSEYRFNLISSIDELKTRSEKWDELWQQSDVALPTMRAEILCQWLEHFHPGVMFAAMTVELDDRIVAALPVMNRRIKGVLKAADLPANEWINTGDLMVAEDVECDSVLPILLNGMNRSPWPLFWFDAVDIDRPKWQSFVRCANELGMRSDVHPRYDVGTIQIDNDWQGYEKALSKNLKKNMKRRDRQLREKGEVQLVHINGRSPDFLDQLKLAFDVEDRSWKGPLGTTVLQSPGIYEYFEKQSQQIAAWGELSLYLLKLDELPIAFEYGYFAKGTYFAHKVSYDEQYSYFAPGQLLRYYQLQEMFGQDDHREVDYIGEITAAVEKWSTDRYRVGRVVLATDKLVGRMMMWSYQRLAPMIRQLRKQRD